MQKDPAVFPLPEEKRGEEQDGDQQYEEAADALAGNDDPTAHYNRGNALARSGRLRDALAAYDTALETDPRHADALHNRTLVARLMEQLRQRSRQQQQDGQSGGHGQPEGDNAQNDASREQERRDDMDQNQERDGSREDAGRDDPGTATAQQAAGTPVDSPLTAEEQQAMAQWLRRIPDDPGGLLRRKFRLEYSKRRRERPQGTDAW